MAVDTLAPALDATMSLAAYHMSTIDK